MLTPEQVLTAVVAGMALLALLIWLIPSPCTCEKCGFHLNERRMAALAAAEKHHNELHRGVGYAAGPTDQYRCGDAECPRNPKPKA